MSEASALGDSYFCSPAPVGNAADGSFVSLSGMACADGNATGIGVNLARRASGKLLIYLEGGGGCWDVTTCWDSLHVQNANQGGFDAAAFQQVMVTGSHPAAWLSLRQAAVRNEAGTGSGQPTDADSG